ncbi:MULTISPECIES: ABC transporter ATP-binding protein [Derxia]|uniref:ABC transporter ATP-binding protein n=1 Tax=Derxia gummosa DSM 723 TaxID=1121388 RepID=A0A9U5CZF2_9BURK|nr:MULTISPECIES: ABC transporter ATP-binding protein [Derxia]
MSGDDRQARVLTGPIPDRPLAFLARYVKARRWLFGALFAAITLAAACAVAVQVGMKLLVDAMASGDRAAVWHPFGFFLALIALESVLWRIGGWLGARAVVASGVDIRVDLFDHLTGHAMRYFREHLVGSVGARVTAAAAATGAILGTLTWNVLPPVVDFVGAVLVLFTVDWRMALALTACVGFVAAVIGGFGMRGRTVHHRYAELASKVGGELVDVVSNVWAVKAFAARRRERDRLAREFGVEAAAQRRSWMYLEKARLLHDLCLWLMAGGMLAWAILLWQRRAITPGDVVLVSALTFRILHGSRDLALALVGMAQQFGAIADTLRVLAAPHALPDQQGARAFRPHGGRIVFEDVGFAYPDGRRVLEHFNLVIEPGQRVGLVGPSGSGKSTLVSLIQRLDDPQQGRILIDGQCLAEVAQDSLREQIAVVPQEVVLFRRSVRDNIRYGRPDASDDEVEAAARHACCHEFIRQLPQGYDTLVGERGATLSGGQRQRIGIARAFLRCAPVLLMDEATSALDSHTEHEVQRALVNLMQDCTVVAVAHRLSTLDRFDRILVLEAGRLVEDGTPAELRARGGAFGRLWRSQQAAASDGAPSASARR